MSQPKTQPRIRIFIKHEENGIKGSKKLFASNTTPEQLKDLVTDMISIYNTYNPENKITLEEK